MPVLKIKVKGKKNIKSLKLNNIEKEVLTSSANQPISASQPLDVIENHMQGGYENVLQQDYIAKQQESAQMARIDISNSVSEQINLANEQSIIPAEIKTSADLEIATDESKRRVLTKEIEKKKSYKEMKAAIIAKIYRGEIRNSALGFTGTDFGSQARKLQEKASKGWSADNKDANIILDITKNDLMSEAGGNLPQVFDPVNYGYIKHMSTGRWYKPGQNRSIISHSDAVDQTLEHNFPRLQEFARQDAIRNRKIEDETSRFYQPIPTFKRYTDSLDRPSIQASDSMGRHYREVEQMSLDILPEEEEVQDMAQIEAQYKAGLLTPSILDEARLGDPNLRDKLIDEVNSHYSKGKLARSSGRQSAPPPFSIYDVGRRGFDNQPSAFGQVPPTRILPSSSSSSSSGTLFTAHSPAPPKTKALDLKKGKLGPKKK